LAGSNTTSHVTGSTRQVAFEYVRPGDRRTTFDAILLHADRKVVIFSHRAQPSKPLYYASGAVIEAGYSVVWFLFKGQPYDIGRFYRPDGSWTGYYVDILDPVQWDEDNPHSIEPLVDLALDLWIAPDGSYQVLDEDEFELVVINGDLTSAQASHARSTLADLVSRVEDGSFPPRIVQEYDRALP
jgi:predicted RNA-binding protein associated with RNAse of E/G family